MSTVLEDGNLMRVYAGESSDVSDRHDICKECVHAWFVEQMEPRCLSRAYFVEHADEGQCCFCGQSVEMVALSK